MLSMLSDEHDKCIKSFSRLSEENVVVNLQVPIIFPVLHSVSLQSHINKKCRNANAIFHLVK